ncbi:MAG TPA: TPM domain-containing protein [Chthoniobacterales bacterium]|nr:TPM domain-containing protein [Chthoniobacterales bacterium]
MASLFAAGFLDIARNDGRRVAALLVAVGIFAGAMVVGAAENIPPKPAGYFNDYAGVVSKEAALRFNEQLAQFERETSNQILVAVFRRMESDSSIEDFTQRVAQAWGVGKKDRRNGAVLFVFIDDRKMYLQVGYGLEGTLPDATAFDITERRIKPHFKKGDYAGGLATGIDLIFKAIRGEYTGSGKTQAEESRGTRTGNGFTILFVCVVIFLIAMRMARQAAGYDYSGAGRRPFFGGWSGGGGGWSSGSSGGGFSGFSGGGGSFGGGGAGSSW